MAQNRGRPRKNVVTKPTQPASRASSSSSQSSNGNPRATLVISKNSPVTVSALVALTPLHQQSSWAAVV